MAATAGLSAPGGGNESPRGGGAASATACLVAAVAEFFLEPQEAAAVEGGATAPPSARAAALRLAVKDAFSPFIAEPKELGAAPPAGAAVAPGQQVVGRQVRGVARADVDTVCVAVATTFHAFAVLGEKKALGDGQQHLPDAPSTAVVRALQILAEEIRGMEDPAAAGPGADESLSRPGTYLWHLFQLHFLQQLSARGGDYAPWIRFLSSPGDAAALAVPEVLLNSTIARTRNRRGALLCKSLCPHKPPQAPSTTFWITDIIDHFCAEWQKSAYTGSGGKEAGLRRQQRRALLESSRAALGAVLGNGNTHASLLAAAVVSQVCLHFVLTPPQGYAGASRGKRTLGAAGSGAGAAGRRGGGSGATYASADEPHSSAVHHGTANDERLQQIAIYREAEAEPSAGDADWCSAREAAAEAWELEDAPQLGKLLEPFAPAPLLNMHCYCALAQLRIGHSMAAQGKIRQRVAITLLSTGVITLEASFTCFHSTVLFESSVSPLSPMGSAPPGEALIALSTAMQNHAQQARMQMVSHAATARPPRSREKKRSAAESSHVQVAHALLGIPSVAFEAAVAVLEEIPHSGELSGLKLSAMTFPSPCPRWEEYLAIEPPHYVPGQFPVKSAAATPAAAGTGSAGAVPTSPCSAGGVAGTRLGRREHATAALITPCTFLVELVCETGDLGTVAAVLRHFLQADDCATSDKVNVFLVPRTAVPNGVNVQTALMNYMWVRMRSWRATEQAINAELRQHTAAGGGAPPPHALLRALARLRALDEDRYTSLVRFHDVLTVCGQYLAVLPFVHEVLQQLHYLCLSITESAANERVMAPHASVRTVCMATTAAEGLHLLQGFLAEVILPWLCVLPPSVPLMELVNDLLVDAERLAAAVMSASLNSSCEEAGDLPPRDLMLQPFPILRWLAKLSNRKPHHLTPHEVLQGTRHDSLLLQSLKRMTRDTVDRYAALLLPVLFANPLKFIDKLLQQVVGYENQYLSIHTRLLLQAPPAVLKLALWAGTATMRRYASEEREGCENRCHLIASFLLVLWRDNPDSFDGAALLRMAEHSLRIEARFEFIFGTELLRSFLGKLLDDSLENEEHHTDIQLRALCAPSATRWLARGAAESFRKQRWDKWWTPRQRAGARELLIAALQEPCQFPAPKGVAPTPAAQVWLYTVGGQILTHLCRLHARLYDFNADLPGTTESILLKSAKDVNTVNDLTLALAELLPVERLATPGTVADVLENSQSGSAYAILRGVCLPHMLAKIQSIIAVKAATNHPPWSAEASGTSMAEGPQRCGALFCGEPTLFIPRRLGDPVVAAQSAPATCWDVLETLSMLTSTHLSLNTAVYDAAIAESLAFIEECGYSAPAQRQQVVEGATIAEYDATSCMPTRLDADHGSFLWVEQQLKRVLHERDVHHQYEQRVTSEGARPLGEQVRSALFDMVLTATGGAITGGAAPRLLIDHSVFFATSYLLPRALLSLEDTVFVAEFCEGLAQHSRKLLPSGQRPACGDPYAKVLGLILTLITGVVALFMGLTDSECKRAGVLVSRLVDVVNKASSMENASALDEAAQSVTADAVDPAAAHAPPPSALMRVLSARAVGSLGEDATLYPLSSKSVAALHSDLSAAAETGPTRDGIPAPQTKRAELLAMGAQLEVYLTKFFFHVLGNTKDVPSHTHRNALIVLGRLLAYHAPPNQGSSALPIPPQPPIYPTQATVFNLLAGAVSHHAVKTSKCYATATAVQKSLQRGKELWLAANAREGEATGGAESLSPTARSRSVGHRAAFVSAMLSHEQVLAARKHVGEDAVEAVENEADSQIGVEAVVSDHERMGDGVGVMDSLLDVAAAGDGNCVACSRSGSASETAVAEYDEQQEEALPMHSARSSSGTRTSMSRSRSSSRSPGSATPSRSASVVDDGPEATRSHSRSGSSTPSPGQSSASRSPSRERSTAAEDGVATAYTRSRKRGRESQEPAESE